MKKNIEAESIKNKEDLVELQQEVALLHRQIDNLCTTSLDIQKQNVNLNKKLRDLQNANKKLKDIQEKKDQFFSMMVHDIKNPTTIIKNLVELLKKYDSSDEERNIIIEDLVASTKQVIALSQEISQVLTLDTGAPRMFYEYADPAVLIEEVIRRNSINVKNKNQTLNIDIQEQLPMFRVDVTKIIEVLDNLVSNAIKYTMPTGHISVSCFKKNDFIVIAIADSGLGMSSEDIEKAFKFGMKLSAKPTGGEHSSGLGLWIVKRILEAHHGKVSINSKLGVGTTFTVQVPISHSTQAIKDKAKEDKNPTEEDLLD